MSLSDAIYNGVFKVCQKRVETYAFLPRRKVKYPFAVVGDVQILPKDTKDRALGFGMVRLDIWADERGRRDVTNISTDLMASLAGLKEIEGYQLRLQVNTSDLQIMADTSTPDDLWHGVLSLTFTIIGGKNDG